MRVLISNIIPELRPIASSPSLLSLGSKIKLKYKAFLLLSREPSLG